jgi:hypothetical protein
MAADPTGPRLDDPIPTGWRDRSNDDYGGWPAAEHGQVIPVMELKYYSNFTELDEVRKTHPIGFDVCKTVRYDPRADCYVGTFWNRGSATDTVRLAPEVAQFLLEHRTMRRDDERECPISPFLKMRNGIATDVILMVSK